MTITNSSQLTINSKLLINVAMKSFTFDIVICFQLFFSIYLGSRGDIHSFQLCICFIDGLFISTCGLLSSIRIKHRLISFSSRVLFCAQYIVHLYDITVQVFCVQHKVILKKDKFYFVHTQQNSSQKTSSIMCSLYCNSY